MADIVIPDDFGNAVLDWTELDSGKQISVTLGYGRLTAGATSPSTHAQDLYTYLTASGSICSADQMNPNWRFDGVRCYFRQGGDLFGGDSVGPAVSGTHIDSGTSLPNSVALVLQKRTSQLGKKNRGRMYMPTLKVTGSFVNTNGNIDGARLTSISAQVANFLDAVGDSPDIYLALLHASADDPDTITSLVYSSRIGNQRRRLN